MNRSTARIYLIGASLLIFLSGCMPTPYIKQFELSPRIEDSKAFDCLLTAGTELGFSPTFVKGINKEAGKVQLVQRGAISTLLWAPAWSRNYRIDATLIREATNAKGVELNINTTYGMPKDTERDELSSKYIDALSRCWGK
jgi:hypothetical protein